ncbi:SDR family oxidoreductase [Terrarubrum flagellatum]|uniref:SDR family oxidoreductase n=1 Tax=Terrirubrum flagellatum TaxID=2895980 RepID=UPI00314508CB
MSDRLPSATATIALPGRVVVVTGGGRGIGRAISEAFLRAGATVAICGRNAPDELPEGGGRKAGFHACDVRKADQAKEFIDRLAAEHGRIDVLVNNAGGSPAADAATASARFSEAIIALNLLAPIHLSQAAHRWMAAQEEGGAIVNIASIASVRPSPGTAVYGAAKAGLLSLTRSLAQEWGPKIRVNCVIAGMIATEKADLYYGSGEARQAIEQSLPMKRLGTGEDIAAAALFLASPLASFVTGASLEAHGGDEPPLFLDILARHAPKS